VKIRSPLRQRARVRRAAPLVSVFGTLVLAACGGGSEAPAAPAQAQKLTPPPFNFEIRTVNNRADLISDGDALVEVQVPKTVPPHKVVLLLNGADVTSSFVRDPATGTMRGLLSGLRAGENRFVADSNGQGNGRPWASLTITNHARSGPVLSGAQHVKPFYCAQPTPQPVNGSVPGTPASGLSGTPDADCTIAAEFKLYYKTSTAGCTFGLPDPVWNIGVNATTVPAQPQPAPTACFKPYDPAAPRPADMASATTDAGVTVDYIVRVERGTMNRGIYDIVSLYQPSMPWTALAPQPQWNGKLYFSFGASTGQPRRQVRPATNWPTLDAQIARGWVVAVNSMTDSARNSNRVLMSETVMMMKERVGDAYGPVKYTMGSGCSGGSINSNTAGSIAPGLLDGVVTSCTYPDSETTSMEVGDCVLLIEAYQKPGFVGAGGLWAGLPQAQINAKKAAINGHPDQSACHAWYNAFGSNGKAGVYFQRLVANNATGALFQQPAATNNCELPNSAVYDPAKPETASLPRCNAWNWAVNIWGTVPGGVAAQDTRDNVGVQYGLKALRDGVIGAEEFVTLNELVGGIDRDSNLRAQRSTADPQALDTAYRSGIVASGRQLAKMAIIDLRGWDDSNINVPPGQVAGANAIPIHHQWYSWAVRDRITAESESGNALNQALWRFARTGLAAPGTLGLEAFLSMDLWLANLVADTSGSSLEARVRNARPGSTADFCLLPSDASQSNRIFDPAVCDADPFLKPSLSPRQVAGGPRAEHVLKCALKPLSASDPDYGATSFTPTQWARLQAVFATGVCDWSKPGIGQTLAVSPLTFRAGPGGTPLPPAPTATPAATTR
jgi:hypothetical protein